MTTDISLQELIKKQKDEIDYYIYTIGTLNNIWSYPDQRKKYKRNKSGSSIALFSHNAKENLAFIKVNGLCF